MSDESVWVYVEDIAHVGVAAYRARDLKRPPEEIDPILRVGLMLLPEEQVRRWEEAEAAWTAARAEMRRLLKDRRPDVIEAIGDFAGYRAAIRADKRSAQ